MKKINYLFALSLASMLTLAGCGEAANSQQPASEPSGSQPASSEPASVPGADEFELNKATTLKEGFTSLANKNSNAPAQNGHYSYAGQDFELADEFKTTYTTEVDNLDYLTNNWTYNSEHYTNMVDGLIENDKYGNPVGALALGYKSRLNDDGTQSWTFQLREGVAWIDNKTGAIYSEVVAQNFVDSIKYVLDPINGSKTAGIVCGQIKGAQEYYDAMGEDGAEEPDFASVGVKAISKYEVEYTTVQPMPYFLTCLTYSPYLPVDGKYLEESGTDFGASENDILVNGAYRVTNHVFQSVFVYSKNEKYWDAEHVYVDRVTKRFYDAKVATSSTARLWFENGYIDSFGVNTQDVEGWNKYVVGLDDEGNKLTGDAAGTIKNPHSDICNSQVNVGDATFIGYFNFVRSNWEYNDSTERSAAQKAATAKALQNVNFRKGFLYGLDVMAYLNYYGDNGINYLMRGYTNRELVSFNGKDYADYVEDVFNQKQGTTGVKLAGINNGSDPVYNAERSTSFFDAAKAELLEGGLTQADLPIQIDVVLSMTAEVQAFQKLMYDHLEENSNGLIHVNQMIPNNSTQNTSWMRQINNYDFSLLSGWGPDYADPQTYLATFCIQGDMVEQLGFDGSEATAELEQQILGEYDALYRAAAAIVDGERLEERYQKFAEAEYALIYEYAIIVPWEAGNAYSAVVSRTVAHQAGTATYGLTSDKLKDVVVSKDIITKAQRNAINAAWEDGKTAAAE